MTTIKISPRIAFHTLQTTPFLALHLVVIGGLYFFPITWSGIALCACTYVLRMLGITIGYHRYFSHRSFKTSRVFQFILALLGTLSAQRGVLWWASTHRHHHRYSDRKEDAHSPVAHGFWHSHLGWLFQFRNTAAPLERVNDLVKFPELRFLDRYFLLPVHLFVLILFLSGGLAAVYWGFVVSTVLLWHGTFSVNSATHVWGTRRYNTPDNSRNNWFVALIALGEGWHNNHHHCMGSARQGFFWWEIDISYYVLLTLERAGIVWDLRKPQLSGD